MPSRGAHPGQEYIWGDGDCPVYTGHAEYAARSFQTILDPFALLVYNSHGSRREYRKRLLNKLFADLTTFQSPKPKQVNAEINS